MLKNHLHKKSERYRPALNWEGLLFTSAALVSLVSASMLLIGEGPRSLYRRWENTIDPTGQPFGRIQTWTGNIKKQAAGSARMIGVRQVGELIHFGDTIYSAEKSMLEVELLPENGGGRFVVGPDTMIRISHSNTQQFGALKKSAEIELVKGTIRSENGNEVPRLQVSRATTKDEIAVPLNPSEEIRVEAIIPSVEEIQPMDPATAAQETESDALVSLAPPTLSAVEAPRLEALETPIAAMESLQSPGRVQEQSSKSVRVEDESYPETDTAPERDATMDKGRIRPLIIEPRNRAVITARDFNGTELQAQWLLEGGAAIADWKVISTDSRKIVLEGHAPAAARGRQNLRLEKPGAYEFVIQVGSRQVSTQFTIDENIELPRPRSAKLSLAPPRFGFDIPEALPARSAHLRLELYRYERDEAPAHVRELVPASAGSSMDISASELGKISYFRWVVVPEQSDNGRAFIGRTPKTPVLVELPAPELKSPAPAAEVSALNPAGEPLSILLTWLRVPLSDEYLLEISRSSDFSSIETSIRTDANYRDFAPKQIGTYWWRVRADSDRAPGVWSQPREFKVIPRLGNNP